METRALRRQFSPYIRGCSVGRLKNDIEECKQGVHFGQGKLTSHDCRRLREREPRVYNALKSTNDGRELIKILDQFGIEVSMNTKEAFEEPTRHLAVFFDNYFIANENGDVIFASEQSAVSRDEHRAGVPFGSLSSIGDLLSDDSPSPLAILGSTPKANAHPTAGPPTGHSNVRNVQVDGVDLSVFIHPFTADSSTLYVVGVILRSSLTDEALRLRLGPAVDATLAIALLLTLLPIIRFWTAGDRAVFRRLNLYGVGVSALCASALGTVLLSGMNAKSIDRGVLDLRLEQVGHAMADKFKAQLAAADAELRLDYINMNMLNENVQGSCSQEDIARSSIGKNVFCPSVCRRDDLSQETSEHWWPTTNPFGAATYTGSGNASLWWPTSSYVLNAEGKRTVCTQYRHDLPLSLNLRSRDYFLEARNEIALYRIDSVVRGRQQIVASLAYDEEDGRENQRVAVSIQKFLSIDGAVLPPHFQYAVIDEAGSTIYHSDEDRISVTNFINDAGNDAEIRAAISYEDGRILNLDYDGVAIRAYVRKLHKDLDWTLIVFRSHSLVDRISALATSLSIISWLLTMLMIFLLCALLMVVPRPEGRDLLPAVMWSSTSGIVGITGAVWGAIGLATIYSTKGSALVVIGLLWPISVVTAVYVLAWRRLRCFGGNAKATQYEALCGGRGQMVWIKVFALASAVFSAAVVPMLSWHGYFRAELSNGLATHFMIETREAMKEKEEDFDRYVDDLIKQKRGQSLRSFLEGSTVGFDHKGERKLFNAAFSAYNDEDVDGPSVAGGSSFSVWSFWRLLAYSPITQQVIWHRSNGSVPESIRSVSDAVDYVTGRSRDDSVILRRDGR